MQVRKYFENGALLSTILAGLFALTTQTANGQIEMRLSTASGALTSCEKDGIQITVGDPGTGLALFFRISSDTKFQLKGGDAISWDQLHKLDVIMRREVGKYLEVNTKTAKDTYGKEYIDTLTIGFKGNLDKLKEFLAGMPEIVLAAYDGNSEEVQKLIKLDRSAIESAGKSGRTPLIAAAMCGRDTLVGELIRDGADVNAKDAHDGDALMYAVGGQHVKVVRSLISAGSKVDRKGPMGTTALYLAAEVGSSELVKLLIEAKSDVNISNDRGATPLFIASMLGNQEVVQILLDAGAKSDVKIDDGRTASDVAKTDKIREMLSK